MELVLPIWEDLFDGEKKMAEVQETLNVIKKSLESKIPRSSVIVVPSTDPE